RRLHFDQQIADAVVLRLLRIGPDEREHPVGVARARGPDLLSIDDPEVALEHGSGAERREIAAGARLTVALTPADASEQCVADEALLLRLGAVLEQRRDEHARSLPHDLVRGARAPELLGDDRRLQRIRRLLRPPVTPRDVAIEVSPLDRLQAER